MIFGRMSPDQKQSLVEHFLRLEYIVAFCGDGANDCGALEAADVGISLSTAEASIAAPLTSQVMNISCVPKVIREGRAALVTSFCCFKFMALYSVIQFTQSVLLCYYAGLISSGQFIYADMVLVVPLALLMNGFKAGTQLVPFQPPSRLISKTVLTEVTGFLVLQFVAQVITFYMARFNPGYVQPDPEDKFNSFEGNGVFFMSSHIYVIVALLIAAGKPFRESLIENKYLLGCASALTLLNVATNFIPDGNWYTNLFNIQPISYEYRRITLFIALGLAVVMSLAHFLLFPLFNRFLGVLFPIKRRSKWQQVEDEFIPRKV